MARGTRTDNNSKILFFIFGKILILFSENINIIFIFGIYIYIYIYMRSYKCCSCNYSF